MVNNQVSEKLCNSRTQNILDKITQVDNKLDKWMNNHASHIENNMKKIQEDIRTIFNRFENEELIRDENNKIKKKFEDSYKFWMPILVGIAIKAVEVLAKWMGWV